MTSFFFVSHDYICNIGIRLQSLKRLVSFFFYFSKRIDKMKKKANNKKEKGNSSNGF